MDKPEIDEDGNLILKLKCKSDGKIYKYLYEVPYIFRDREICLESVSQDGWTLRDVPNKMRDREISLAAVSNNGKSLQSVLQLPGDLN